MTLIRAQLFCRFWLGRILLSREEQRESLQLSLSLVHSLDERAGPGDGGARNTMNRNEDLSEPYFFLHLARMAHGTSPSPSRVGRNEPIWDEGVSARAPKGERRRRRQSGRRPIWMGMDARHCFYYSSTFGDKNQRERGREHKSIRA